jgi:hypothetical protein
MHFKEFRTLPSDHFIGCSECASHAPHAVSLPPQRFSSTGTVRTQRANRPLHSPAKSLCGPSQQRLLPSSHWRFVLPPPRPPRSRVARATHFVPLHACMDKDLHTTTLCAWHSTSCLHPRAACRMPVTKNRQSAERRVVTRTGRDLACCAPALPRWAVLARPRTRTVARNSPYEVHFV